VEIHLIRTLILQRTLKAIRILNIYHIRQTISAFQERKWCCEIVNFLRGPLSDNSILFLYQGRVY